MLPTPIRGRLAELAGAVLDYARAADVPSRLRPIMRFAPGKRAKLGQPELLTALRDSTVFRAAVLDWCRKYREDALSLASPDPVVVGTAALLLDSPVAAHYVELVGFRTEQGRLRHERDTERKRAGRLAAEVDSLRGELDQARTAAVHAKQERGEEADRLRKRLREQGVRLKEAKDDAQQARAEQERLYANHQDAVDRINHELERAHAREREARQRAERAESEVEVARQSAREARQGDEVRLALLLDTLEGAVGGLRRELSPSGSGPRPADVLHRAKNAAGTSGALTDAATLDRVLRLPAVHLIVDGYNVTKTGYPELPLADQRDRLAHQLAALVARTGAEVTVVFDGADVLSVPAAGPRGVRVLFSDAGVQADDVIRDVVAAEPWGRQLVVATSDREIVSSVSEHGAYVVTSALLLDRVSRV